MKKEDTSSSGGNTSFFGKIVENLSLSEKIIFYFGLYAGVFALFLGFYFNFYKIYTTTEPDFGGSIKEIIFGVPRFINPIIATTQADKDMTSLVFAGLLKKNYKGELVPELAKKYEIKDDGKTYIFTLKDNLKFHDGKKLTADDVIFTINLIKDPIVKSPLKTYWDGIEVKKIDDKTIEFKLREKFSSFLDHLTIGILPEHLWEEVPKESISLHKLNIEPIGAGPFAVKKIVKDENDVPVYYILKSFKNYSIKKPYINEIKTIFLSDEKEAIEKFKSNEADAIAGISPDTIENLDQTKYEIHLANTKRIFYIFFNHTKNKLFADQNIKEAIKLSIDKEKIVKDVLKGYANKTDNFVIIDNKYSNNEKTYTSSDKLLRKLGYEFSTSTKKWEKDGKQIHIKIDTAKTNELTNVAENIKMQLEKSGFSVNVNSYEISQLNQNIIRPREYESLLFGQLIKTAADLYAFWHSSQREDPGLNIAMYANPKLDALLEKIRKETDKDELKNLIKKVNDILKNDTAAIPIYSPKFIYITKPHIKGIKIENLSDLSERFANIEDWYIKTQRIWIFLKK